MVFSQKKIFEIPIEHSLNINCPNRFEKDLLDRAAEEERSKETTLDIGCTKKLPKQSSNRNEETWQLNDIDNSLRDSPREGIIKNCK